jgi:hypothetical protein
MLFNFVGMNINRNVHQTFLCFAPSNDNVRNKILDATLFITQVEMKPLLVAHGNVLGV